MATQMIFTRYEIKYLITKQQQRELLEAFDDHMERDAFPDIRIYNLYFDTSDHLLIRNSLDKPLYKEKIRIRSYAPATSDDLVYLEIKKKYDSLVSKRRMSTQLDQVLPAIDLNRQETVQAQIKAELQYCFDHYQDLRPMMYLGYDRLSYKSKNEAGLRITMDSNIHYRTNAMALQDDDSDLFLLSAEQILLEIKTLTALPLWLVKWLSDNRIYKCSYSKYGTAYTNTINEIYGGLNNV